MFPQGSYVGKDRPQLQEQTFHLIHRTHTSSLFNHKIYIQTTIKKHIMKAALKNAVDKGVLVQVKNSYKLSADAKKDMSKKPAAKAPKKKATAPKKVTKAASKKVRLSHSHCKYLNR